MICEGSHQVGRNSASSPVGRERLMGYFNPDGPHLQSDSDLQERGAGTVMVLGLLVAFAIAIMGIMAIGDVVATRDRSQNVADVAASDSDVFAVLPCRVHHAAVAHLQQLCAVILFFQSR